MRRRHQQDSSRADNLKMDKEAREKTIYVFRCEESGLYAFTTDRMGRRLPAQIYPRIKWQFEEAVIMRIDGNSPRDKIMRVAFEDIAKHGFYLIHTALYGELLGLCGAKS